MLPLLALLASSAFGQALAPLPPTEAPTKTLTWDDCVALAALKNPALVSSEYARKASRASYLGSYNGIMPSVNLSNSFSESNGSRRPLYQGQFQANWDLLNMGQVASIRSAKASYSQAQANLRQASANLRFNLLSAFAQAYFAERNVDVARRILDIQRRNAEEVTLRYQSGKEYKGNMMNAKAQLLQAQASLGQSLRALHATRRALDQQLGLDDFEDVAVTGTLVAQMPPDFPAHMADYVDQRPDVAVQQANVQTANASLATAQSTLFPELTANYTRGRLGLTEFPSSSYSWSAGATLSYPLFGSGPTSTLMAIKSAKAGLQSQEETLRSVRNAARVDLENSWASYSSAMDNATAQTALLESLRQRNDEGQIRYASGLLTFDNWQVIVTQWVQAEQQEIQAQQSAVTAEGQWEKSLGKALGE